MPAEEEEGVETGEGATVDDTAAVPLDDTDLGAIRSYVERITRLATD